MNLFQTKKPLKSLFQLPKVFKLYREKLVTKIQLKENKNNKWIEFKVK